MTSEPPKWQDISTAPRPRRKLWFDAPAPPKPVGYWMGKPIYNAKQLATLQSAHLVQEIQKIMPFRFSSTNPHKERTHE